MNDVPDPQDLLTRSILQLSDGFDEGNFALDAPSDLHCFLGMEKSIQFRHMAFLLSSLLTWTAVAQNGPGAPPVETNGNRRILEFRDPDTQEKVEVSIPNLSPSELRQYSPSKVRINVSRPAKPKFSLKAAGAAFLHEYPAEWTAFSLALGISAREQIGKDPAALKHFVEQSVVDPVAHISFAGFMMGTRASTSFMQTLGLAYDVHTAPAGEFNIFKHGGLANMHVYATPSGPNIIHQRFAPLLGPMGLAAGTVVSGVITEFLKDPDINVCAKAMVSDKVPKDQAAVACDRAWENWAVSKKIADYAPDIFSTMSTALIQAYVVNKSISKVGGLAVGIAKKGAERYIPVVLRGMTLAWDVGKTFGGGPALRFALTVGNIFVFMEINEFIAPYFKRPWEQRRQGKDITEQIQSLALSVKDESRLAAPWRAKACPKVDTQDPTQQVYLTNFDVNACEPEVSPVVRLAKLSEKQKTWRQFLLSDAFSAHSNWQDYVSQFSTLYANAYSFYSNIANNINWQRTEKERLKVDPSPLYEAEPLFGVSAEKDKTDRASQVKAISNAIRFIENYLRDESHLLNRNDIQTRTDLARLSAGLRAIDSRVPLAAIYGEENPVLKRLTEQGMSDKERELIEFRLRGQIFEKTIQLLLTKLKFDSRWNDNGVEFPSELYSQLGEVNPFMKIRILLGNPTVAAPGVAYLKAFNDDAAMISQDSKNNHPDGIGRIRTESMTDYLLASMVCGPEVELSQAEKIKIFERQKAKTWDQFLGWFGYQGWRPPQDMTQDALVEIENTALEAVAPNSKVWTRPSENQMVVEYYGFSATFRPPRIVENVPDDLCRQIAQNQNRDKVWIGVHEARYQIDGKVYNGLLEIVKDRARTSMIGTEARPTEVPKGWQAQFDKWWLQNVDPAVKKTLVRFQNDFTKLLKEKYLPAMTKKESTEYNGVRFELGVLNSIQSELHLYVTWLEQVLPPTMSEADRDEVHQLLAKIENEYREFSQLMTDLEWVRQSEESASKDYKQGQDDSKKLMDELNKKLMMDPGQAGASAGAMPSAPVPGAPASNLRQDLQRQLLKNINELHSELDSYFGILRTVKVIGQ